MFFHRVAAVAFLASGALFALTEERPKVLFLTHSAGYRHDVVAREGEKLSIAEEALKRSARGFQVECTQDCSTITAEGLAGYAAVVFYTTGELAIDADALVDFVRRGGGFIGVHCATDTLYKHAGYGEMIGGRFDGHPWHEEVSVRVEDRRHPATWNLGPSFAITDEIYQFKEWNRDDVRVLLSLDPGSVDASKGKRKDGDYAIAWTRRFGDGRVFYTALGHRPEVWADPRFLDHLVGGISWTIGLRGERDEQGFERLSFDKGWVQAGPGRFVVADGVATTEGTMGLWYYAPRRFRNFILRVSFRQKRIESNAGVFVRFPRVDGDPWIPVKEGYEIQIAGDKPGKNSTGAIYSFQAADSVPIRPAGEWNEYEIAAIGQEYTVRLNGLLINRYTGDRAIEGMIGLQNHVHNADSVVSFRDVRVIELPDDAVGYHVLFDGRGTDGWRMAGPGGFTLSDGAIVAKGGMGLFWHERVFGDQLLMIEWRTTRKEDNSGVFVRFPDPGKDPWVAVHKGYEIQICDTAAPKCRTGSIYSFQDATHVPTREVGQWNTMTIRIVGQRYTVWVNGELVNEYTGERSIRGHIGVQNHDDASPVAYRDIRVVELGAAAK